MLWELRLSQKVLPRHEAALAMVLLTALELRGRKRVTVLRTRRAIHGKEQVKV